MDRVFSAGASGTPPAAPLSPSSGYPVGGNPGGGIAATKPGPWWFYMITEEIRAVIVAAGLTPDHTDVSQLAAAILSLSSVSFASSAEAQGLSILTKSISPGRLAAALQGANQSLAASGYQKLPGGLIFQWGKSAGVAGNTNVTVTLPISFPTACLAVVASVNGSNTNTSASVVSFSATQIVLNNDDQAGAVGTPGLFFFSIGY